MQKKHLRNWEMIWMLAKTDLKMRYQGSVLGAIWVFLKPFCLYLVLNFVFSHLFFKNSPDYSVRLLIGIVLWSFFSEATMVGMNSLISKAQILRKIYIPKWTIIVSSVIHSAMAFLFNMLILLLFLFFYYHIYPGPRHLMMFMVYVLLIYGISLGFSFITAPLFVKFRDINQVWEVVLMVLFYASPIIYPITILPPDLQTILFLNPMTLLIEHSRTVLIYHTFARLDHLLIFIALFIPFFLFSIWFLKRSSRNLVERM